MDIKKYKALLRAADCGSFAKAAQELMYTQSGITHMMNNLEKELGFPMFVRTNSGVMLTDEGKNVLPLIRELVNLNEQLEQEFAQIHHMDYGNLKIASYSSVAICWLPRIMKRFRSQYPNVRVEILEEGNCATMETWLSEGRVELCFFTLEPEYTFDKIEILDDPMLAVLPKDHPLTSQAAVSVQQLVKEPFLMSNAYQDVLRLLKRSDTPPNVICTSNLDHTLISMIEQGLGVSIMSALMMSGWEYRVTTRPLSPAATRKLGFAARSLKNLSPAAKKFISCTREVLREILPQSSLSRDLL
ncbi:LysR family transcriptional regulator [Bacilliculturomica massiliensis]|uniref:LysR family transcriptional regulator n=1 Tax=Bacilliculturomica massiliensis TaxID=1917867 RepID=UPI0010323B47|nr:LysR family transcriptional regulator [Bacilliculturomica massiliensis]